MQPYQYKPLPSSSSIRILILYPAADTSSALECDVIIKDRLTILRGPDNKAFDAVSYVWGSGAHDIPLYCKSEGTYLYISAVVDGMLRNLRKGHKERRLWVDAMCLNQKDDEEKSIQVQQMGQIYHMADKVHIWLGPAVATTPLAFAFIRTLVAKFDPTPVQARDPTTEEILETIEELFQHRNLQPVLDLLQNTWFARRWTLQEGFLARDAIVRCGDNKIPWHWFVQGSRLIEKRAHEFQDITNDQSALYALNVLKTLKEPADLLSMLWTLHTSECSDPRDRIYSLLSLAQDMHFTHTIRANKKPGTLGLLTREIPVPDYSLSVDAVYRGFTGECISTNGFLHILLHIDAFGRLLDANLKWPSWVPNWTRARDRERTVLTSTRMIESARCVSKDTFYNLDGLNSYYHSPYELRFLYAQPCEYSIDNYHGLLLYGKCFHKTIQICDPWPKDNNADHQIKYLADWIHEESILHLPEEELNASRMQREVVQRLLLLVTGSNFFGYARAFPLEYSRYYIYEFQRWVQGGKSRVDRRALHLKHIKRLANLLYPLILEQRSYTSEQIYSKEHLDERRTCNPPPDAENRWKWLGSRHELSDLLDDVSRMMREAKKQLIVTSCDNPSKQTKRHHWISPIDVKMGDVVTGISYCGRIGALLRPIKSPPELKGRPAFQLIGILWSFEEVQKDSTAPEVFFVL
ncbi:hypothetical protein NW768_011207 [Fusarium equiseti]|uniref:Heterokaryon incompatibility domain-containing protein n=1 Tax=Fusarium equiseti TaxID=61235 RepID=A0ABQ8QY43_FUSEQ|nr:hypothetical protein NW768_011207 [Fusarium equiseti]